MYIYTLFQINMEKILSTNVKRLCKQQGKQLKDLALEMSIDPASLTRALNGNARLDTIEKIASALHVPLKDLFEEPTNIDGYVVMNGVLYKINGIKDLRKITIDNL